MNDNDRIAFEQAEMKRSASKPEPDMGRGSRESTFRATSGPALRIEPEKKAAPLDAGTARAVPVRA